jgi:16S rRNA (uracil1498-N3)-methyltransferase
MRLSRLFINSPLIPGQLIDLPDESVHYLLTVLRLRVGTPLILFNGQGGEYSARLTLATKKNAQLQVEAYYPIERESALTLTLVQAIARPDHTDYIIQKAVELGVNRLIPIITERTPPLNHNKLAKREHHWRKIIISACEQCGRNRLPLLEPIQSIEQWLTQPPTNLAIVLAPQGQNAFNYLINKEKSVSNITVLIGAEGGLTANELQQAINANYLDIHLGTRILRTETAAITMLAICQSIWGDLSH